MSKIVIVILAAGSGTRMGGDIPKQFFLLQGKPILVRSIESFLAAFPGSQIVVVLADSEVDRWTKMAKFWGVDSMFSVVIGGSTRFESVQNALKTVGDCDYIAIHDGVRPLVSQQTILKGLECAKANGSGIPVVEVIDSYREIEDDGNSKIVDRSKLRAVQTPQWFDAKLINEAYGAGYEPCFTDDASVVERLGHKISLYEGESINIKITTPMGMAVGEAILRMFPNR